jgi:hypothetical protein
LLKCQTKTQDYPVEKQQGGNANNNAPFKVIVLYIARFVDIVVLKQIEKVQRREQSQAWSNCFYDQWNVNGGYGYEEHD